MKRIVILGFVAIGLSGCLDRDQTSAGLAKALSAVDSMDAANNSPDITVKSWWRLRDASLSIRIEACKNDLKLAAPYFEKLSKLSSNERYNSSNCSYKISAFDRQITKVEVQSETRAIVTAQIKNISPPEEGAVLTAEDKKAKDTGIPFQYLLERQDTKNGWQITKISSFSSYAKDWQDIYPKPEPSNNRYVYDFVQ
ncbi:hypothetical protein HU733_02760 [Pseudomonas paralactis]|uniref:hypothetical protein n=1 Tax=Pseudomonas paralactis TaxID=1615673 RepID=UPI001645D8B2|nr:hypothetical protein [Pseudomonas paralactis]MBC3254402.1 hypothetical protein [Pseudomonas paralactis]